MQLSRGIAEDMIFRKRMQYNIRSEEGGHKLRKFGETSS